MLDILGLQKGSTAVSSTDLQSINSLPAQSAKVNKGKKTSISICTVINHIF